MGRIKTTRWEAADHLESESDMAAYLEAALEEGNVPLIAAAIGDIARAKRMTDIARLGLVVLCFIALATLPACAPEVPSDLQQAVAVAQYMASPRWLGRTAFPESAPDDPKPSDFVRYVFSDFGVAEWPMALDPREEEQLRATRTPVLPRTVALVPNAPSMDHGMQVVLRPDDAAGVLHIVAYEHPQMDPVIEVEQEIRFDLVKQRSQLGF